MIPLINITAEELEILENYLDKNLPGEELTSSEERLRSDPEWSQKLTQVRLLVTGIQEAALAERLNEYHQSMEQETLPVKAVREMKKTVQEMEKPVREMKWKKVWLVAASLFIVLVATWLLVKPSANEKLFTEYFSRDPGLPTTMSTGTGNEYAFAKGMVDYKTGNYQAALDNWKRLLAATPASETLNYFTGCGLLAIDSAAASLDYFAAVNSNSALFKDALWYKGLALLKLDRLEEAKVAITASGNEKAEGLMEKLK